MNNSNAAAKRRRAGIQPTTPPMPSQNQPNGISTPQNGQSAAPNGGYTLPQVIALIDTRLITLENFMKDTKESTDPTIPNYSNDSAVAPSGDGDNGGAVFMDSKEFTDFVDDINQRFQLFAEEINGLKEIVLKLQGFTMDVNKMLLASLSKNGETVPNITFDTDDSVSSSENEVADKMELAEQTFILESSSSVPSDGIESAVEKAVSSSGKTKKR